MLVLFLVLPQCQYCVAALCVLIAVSWKGLLVLYMVVCLSNSFFPLFSVVGVPQLQICSTGEQFGQLGLFQFTTSVFDG